MKQKLLQLSMCYHVCVHIHPVAEHVSTSIFMGQVHVHLFSSALDAACARLNKVLPCLLCLLRTALHLQQPSTFNCKA